MSIASLPMYDLPALRQATDDWWAGLARVLTAAGIESVPECLTRQADLEELWRHPELLISQTCGYPLTHAFAGQVRLVATPAYDVAGCDGALYRSVFLVRDGDPAEGLADLRGRRVAINSRTSQSGYNCLRRALAPLAAEVGGGALFSEVVVTGGHGASLAALRDKRADLAAVASLRVLAWSAAAPGLPYVTRAAIGEDELAALREALLAAAADPDLAAARRALSLKSFEVLPLEAYAVIDDMEAAAVSLGYPEIL